MNPACRRLLAATLLSLVCVSAARAERLLRPDHAEHLPHPDHVVIVIEENHGYAQIIDKRNSASYIHALAKRGMLFTRSYGVSHPSQPNYLALFSGSTQGISNDACLGSFDSDNLASSLLDRGFSFATFSESLPATGDLGCAAGAYQRKHNPAANWQGTRLPAAVNRRFADFANLPRGDFSGLPTVSFVIPNQDNDMHDGSFEAADEWLKTRIAPYVDWAMTHNSLLILTWDEDDFSGDNRIVTILAGQMVKPGTSAQRIDHYSVLRMLLDFYDLPALSASRDAEPIRGIWKKR
jgi:hypothetical protein